MQIIKTLPFSKKNNFELILLSISFLYILYRVTFIKSSLDGILLFSVYSILSILIYYRNLKVNYYKYLGYCVIPPAITLFTEFVLNDTQSQALISNLNNHQILFMYNINYTYLLVFIFLPFILVNLKYKATYLLNFIAFSTITYICLNSYLTFFLKLNRDTFLEHFGQIINYDALTILTTLITFIYSFYLYESKNKIGAWFLFSISLFAILLNIMHGSRGSWLALPFIFLYTMWKYRKTCKPFIYSILVMGVIGLLSISIFNISGITDRLQAAYSDFNIIKNNSQEITSIGSRLTMWQHSIEDFKASPFSGIGSINVAQQLCDLTKAGKLAGGGNGCLTHMHNIFFQELASHGFLGILSLAIFFFYPLFNFLKHSPVNNNTTKLIQVTGVSTIMIVMICGFTDYFFISEVATCLYALIILVLMTNLDQMETNDD